MELKPCPFCGGKAYLFVNDGVKVMCSKCRISTVPRMDNSINYSESNNAITISIEDWNRRLEK
jgi:hypothetical protein